MRVLYLMLLVLLSTIVRAQKYGEYYVTHSNDTIQCDILNHSNLEITVSENGQKKKRLRAKDIKMYSVFKGALLKYTLIGRDKSHFYQEKINGKLGMYEISDLNVVTYTVQNIPVLLKDDLIVRLPRGQNNRKIVSKLIADCPSVLMEWNNKDIYPTEAYERVVESYNKCVD